jgi:hypothetical protein
VERRYSSYSFTTSALDGGEWSASRPSRALPPGERTSGTHWTGGWVGPRAGWTRDRGKILSPCRGSNPDHLVVQPVVRHYTARANPLPYYEVYTTLILIMVNALLYAMDCIQEIIWLGALTFVWKCLDYTVFKCLIMNSSQVSLNTVRCCNLMVSEIVIALSFTVLQEKRMICSSAVLH